VFESEFERSLFALRQEKLEAITQLGQAAYPNHFAASHSIPEVRAAWGEVGAEVLNEMPEAERPNVTVAGRIMAIRAQGKALRSTSCWTWAITSASAAISSAPAPAS
jgi:lysyl-tRNA synthetase class 2